MLNEHCGDEPILHSSAAPRRCRTCAPTAGPETKATLPERVVRGDDHRRRRETTKRTRAGAGSGDVSMQYKLTTRSSNHTNFTLAA